MCQVSLGELLGRRKKKNSWQHPSTLILSILLFKCVKHVLYYTNIVVCSIYFLNSEIIVRKLKMVGFFLLKIAFRVCNLQVMQNCISSNNKKMNKNCIRRKTFSENISFPLRKMFSFLSYPGEMFLNVGHKGLERQRGISDDLLIMFRHTHGRSSFLSFLSFFSFFRFFFFFWFCLLVDSR